MLPSDRLRLALPQGRTLPDEDLARRHRFLLALLWAHVVVLPAIALAHGAPAQHAALEAALVLPFAAGAALLGTTHRRLAGSLVATGLLTSSAVLVHVMDGVIEAHFHFFVVVVLLTLYEDWVVFLLAVVEVVVHHGVMGAIDPGAVFNHPDALAHPWKWAAIHAAFVAAAGASAVAAWRLNEDVRDQSDRALARARAAEREAADTMLELERSNHDLERFAAVASHDLREPLRTVAGFLQLLESRASERLDADGREFVRHALDGTRRMERLVHDMLELARVERSAPPEDAVDLTAVLAGVLAGLGDAVHRTQATIRHGRLPVVRGDAGQLAQLLQNLVANALKFSDDAPKVTIEARPLDRDTIVLSVVDAGIGIDPAQAERVFQPFQRLHAAERFEGTGIGLALCRRIAERHGGRIWAEPAEGGGTAVRVELPLARRTGRRKTDAVSPDYSATMPS